MKLAGLPDTLMIINGPQDGIEFPITARTLAVGSEVGSGIQISLDSSVALHHAAVTPVGNGYRVRGLCNRIVSVGGKKAGRIKSRILRHGDILKVGHTELVLECSVDGLASRSEGISFENDLIWAARHFGKRVSLIGYHGLRYLGRIPYFLMRHWFLTGAAVSYLLYQYVPAARGLGYSLANFSKTLLASILG
jgi:hypothetical protein